MRHFKATWKYHHPLEGPQFQFAGLITTVAGIGYYHGGDVLYTLRDTGAYTWHEGCLRIPGEVKSTAEEMNDCGDLDLVSVTEPGLLSLRLIIAELTPSMRSDTPPPPVEGAHLIEHGSRDRLFEVRWSHYVSYSILNESYSRWDDGEEFQGKSFRLYSKSHYLDYLKTIPMIQILAPSHHHWRIVCVNHIIDVASEREPSIARYGKAAETVNGGENH